MKPTFTCLYFLEHIDTYIIEVKRTDLPIDAEPEVVFHWLKIDKPAYTVTPLTFRSMDSAGEVEERFFEEGYLKFNATEGTFIEKYNSGQHPLSHKKEWKLSTQLSACIVEFLEQRTA